MEFIINTNFLINVYKTDISAEQKLCQLSVFCTGEEGPEKMIAVCMK